VLGRILDVAVLPKLLEGIGRLLCQLVMVDPEPTNQARVVGNVFRQFALVRLEPFEQALHGLNQFIQIVGTWLAPSPH
jgi:hypothetical protein